MIVQPVLSSESILGYTLRQRIGGGGYGEVWVAEAPGGLLKAIKIVYGYHDENRAQRELKSLNRIREVRHPFLLSLERIDIVKGRLIVVTELAEKSLKDRFDECTKEGIVGIPRDELLGYLRDAAEALDYLGESHSLQHLDVKPENLLLLSGHVKVADFGLVKDIHDGTQSLMAGLTPTYAPPELFDGRPSRRSDQYSLAIVFQEMLTGMRPFSGRTAAQLASQHLHGVPQLGSLTPFDQNVVRRALAKDPQVRFPDCRSFVEELFRRKVTTGRRMRPEADPVVAATSCPDTPDATIILNDDRMAAVLSAAVERKLPPLDHTSSPPAFRPTLFIGIGQTAAVVMTHLKRRLRERLGTADEIPSLRILCIDTDAANLYSLTSGDGPGVLNSHEILPIPLRSAMEYRDNASMHLPWLSRRWIYNIPRSLQTEGIRPLGRLAFVDHHRDIFQRIDRALHEITDKQAAERTAHATPLRDVAPATEPQVFIVASISGGIGSGMVADLAYSVRSSLLENGYDDDAVHAILMLTDGRSSNKRDLSVANAFSCLSELYHYGHVAGYPGDASCGMPAFDLGPTFGSTYVISMGIEPLPEEYEAMSDNLAEYLFLSSATQCSSYFEACRRDQMANDNKMVVRTVGVTHSGNSDGDVLTLPAHVIGGCLLRTWLDSQSDQLAVQAREAALGAVKELRLDPDDLANRLHDLLRQKLGESPQANIERELRTYRSQTSPAAVAANPKSAWSAMEHIIDDSLGLAAVRDNARFQLRPKHVLEHGIQEIIQATAKEVEAIIFASVDVVGGRFARAELTRGFIYEKLCQNESALVNAMRTLRESSQDLETRWATSLTVRSDRGGSNNAEECERRLTEMLHAYGELRWKEFLLGYAKRYLAFLVRSLEDFARPLQEIRQQLQAMAQQFTSRYEEHVRLATLTEPGDRRLISTLILQLVVGDAEKLAVLLDQRLQSEFNAPGIALSATVRQSNRDWREKIVSLMYHFGRKLAAEHLATSQVEDWLGPQVVSPDRLASWLRESVNLAVPHLVATCGGGSRLIVATPAGNSADRLAEIADDSIVHGGKYIPATQGDIVACYEVGGISAVQVAAQLMLAHPDCAELVGRIHSRIDVDWTPIVRLG